MTTESTVKEKPILMSGAMVRAILRDENPKTQTRRIIKPILGPQAYRTKWEAEGTYKANGVVADIPVEARAMILYCPFSVGMKLWVKETFQIVPNGIDGTMPIYRADGEHDRIVPGKWKPSIFMPRIRSRITLEITGVRVERLNDISEEDAKAEGVEVGTLVTHGYDAGTKPTEYIPASSYREAYFEIWESINGPDSWAKNPWVWVISFRRPTP